MAVTALYTAMQFVQLFLAAGTWQAGAYILYHMGIFVIWLIIVAAVVSMGFRIRRSTGGDRL
jgi:hypothetical protein